MILGLNNLLRNQKCDHSWTIIRTSNVLQLISDGYPQMLVERKCDKCGKYEYGWTNVSINALDDEKMVIAKWGDRLWENN